MDFGKLFKVKQVLMNKDKTGGSSVLQMGIQGVYRAYQNLPKELTLQEQIIEETKANKGFTDKLLYKKYLTTLKVPAAYNETVRRVEYIQSLDTPEKKKDEVAKCAEGVEGLLHFISQWAWTEDSRKESTILVMPFIMFDFQRDLLISIYNAIYRNSSNLLVEKSRDMGVTWALLIFIVHQVLFVDNFNALITSYKEELVDSKDSPNTLFERMRFIVRHLPDWMLPPNWSIKKHMPNRRMLNPVRGSSAIGETSTQDVGRGGRFSMIFLDEFATFPEGGFQVWSSVAYSSSSIIPVSTPKGKFNKFAKLRFSTSMPFKRLHWNNHPWKNDIWYNMQKYEMSSAEIAQELDINYEASQTGLVFPEFNPIYHVITWTEFAHFFGENARDETGKPMIPFDWPISVRQDVGFTPEHRCVTTWVARPTAAYPLSDSFFFFREYTAPLDSSPLDVVEAVRELEGNSYRHITDRKMSHEQKGLRMVYAEYGQNWSIWETDYSQGIGQMKAYLSLIDKDKPHPFRADLRDMSGQYAVMARPRVYIVVSDECLPYFDDTIGKYIVPDGSGDKDFSRGRMEVEMYHFPASEEGKPVRQQRPFKALDDAMDTWRAHACSFPPLLPLGDDALIEQALPLSLRREAIANCSPEEWAYLVMTRHMERKSAERQVMEQKQPYWRERFWGK